MLAAVSPMTPGWAFALTLVAIVLWVIAFFVPTPRNLVALGLAFGFFPVLWNYMAQL